MFLLGMKIQYHYEHYIVLFKNITSFHKRKIVILYLIIFEGILILYYYWSCTLLRLFVQKIDHTDICLICVSTTWILMIYQIWNTGFWIISLETRQKSRKFLEHYYFMTKKSLNFPWSSRLFFWQKGTSSDQFAKVSAARPNAFSAMYKEGHPGDKIEEGKQLGYSNFWNS